MSIHKELERAYAGLGRTGSRVDKDFWVQPRDGSAEWLVNRLALEDHVEVQMAGSHALGCIPGAVPVILDRLRGDPPHEFASILLRAIGYSTIPHHLAEDVTSCIMPYVIHPLPELRELGYRATRGLPAEASCGILTLARQNEVDPELRVHIDDMITEIEMG